MANNYAASQTVTAYIGSARTLLQDLVPTYRYSDNDLVEALNFGLVNARRLRPDLFLSVSPQRFDGANNGTDMVTIADAYRIALIYFMVGHVTSRDEEDTSDQRSAMYLGKFTSQLLVLG